MAPEVWEVELSIPSTLVSAHGVKVLARNQRPQMLREMSDIYAEIFAVTLHGYRKRSEQLIKAGFTDLESAMDRMILGTPGFANCPVFREHFPVCFLEVQSRPSNSQGSA